jgi:uncharacterized protein YcbK (DUF882 family)
VIVLRLGRLAAASTLASSCGVAAAACLAFLVGTSGTQDAIANGDTRTLSLYHNHTRESLTVTFRRNGQYDPRALEQLNWFLRDWRLDEPTRMDPRLFDVVWEVVREVGANEPVRINSAYRSPQTNAMLRRRSRAVAKNSQHMRGKAMDFFLPDVPIERIRAVGMRLQEGGVGYYPSAYTPFVHLDVGSVRAWPRMTRDQLARLFPDGKTVHIPSDGEPMARYEEARAEILARGGSVAGYAVASAEGSGRRKGFWATLFGFADEDEDAEEVRAVRGREVYVARRAPPPSISPNRDSVYAALETPRPAPQPERIAARPAPRPEPEPEPAPVPAVALALQKPIDEPAPAVPQTRIAGLPAAVATPAGPRLSWQQGPAAADAEPAPLPPRRPEEPVATGALSYAPLPPSRPGLAPVRIAEAEPSPAEPPHPLPPRRPETQPAPVAAPPAAPMPIGAKPALASAGGADERNQLRQLFAAPAPRRAAPSAKAASLITAQPAVPPGGFAKEPIGNLAANRFSGSAQAPPPLVR